MTTYPVFCDPDLSAAGPGRRYTLAGAEGRHAATVRRLRPGETIDIVNGGGLRVRGVVAAVGKDTVEIDIAEITREPVPSPRVILVQALGKGGRDEAAIEAATELGVDAVIAWQSARSVSVWNGPKRAKGLARWAAILAAAMKQSRRAHLPELIGFAAGAEVTGLIPADARVLILHESASESITAADLDAPAVCVVVGPEGGLTTDEVRMLTGTGTGTGGGAAVTVGPNILRTSTAGPAAVAVLNARLQRW